MQSSSPLTIEFEHSKYDTFLKLHQVRYPDRVGILVGLRASRHFGCNCDPNSGGRIPPTYSLRNFLLQRATYKRFVRLGEWTDDAIETSVLGPFQPFFAQRNVILGFCVRRSRAHDPLGQMQPLYWVSVSHVMGNGATPNFPHELFIITMRNRDSLCVNCGQFYDANEDSSGTALACRIHTGTIRLAYRHLFGDEWDNLPVWTCCDEVHDSYSLACRTPSKHLPLDLRGFAQGLNYWEQIRLMLAWKRGSASGASEGVSLVGEIVDAIVYLLVELNDAEFCAAWESALHAKVS